MLFITVNWKVVWEKKVKLWGTRGEKLFKAVLLKTTEIGSLKVQTGESPQKPLFYCIEKNLCRLAHVENFLTKPFVKRRSKISFIKELALENKTIWEKNKL